MNGWEQLNCNYFAETCREVVREYLEVYCFAERELTTGGGIVYSRFDTFLELNYDYHLYPQYSFQLSVGFIVELANNRTGYRGIPLWYLVPEDHPYRKGTIGGFRNKDELVGLLDEARRNILEYFAIPLLSDRDRLASTVGKFNFECNEQRRRNDYEREMEIMRREANLAWGRRDYKAVRKIFEKHRNDLTPSEQLKLNYACKKLQEF